jgi:methionyl-tRNA formyltransferase
MIPEIIETSPQPVAQKGEPYFFKRRTPAQSEVPKSDSLEKVYDHIRMLDADGYPKAFIEYGGLRLEFDQARLESDSLAARVVFKRAKCE